ncbi:MAG: hypothetical protein GX620_07940 [Chloroflexi bacterium]|nr:hypothetical protein [Chloroflexota bacterium]
MRSLQQCLLDLDLVHLRAIARYWDLDVIAGRERDVAFTLAERMPVAAVVFDAWAALADQERQAMEALIAAGGSMPTKIFSRRWGEIRPMGPGRMAREMPWEDPVSPAESLWYKGMISRAFEQASGESYEVTFVPAEIMEHLPAVDAPRPRIHIQSVESPDRELASGDQLADDVCTLLIYLQNEDVRLGPDQTWPAHHWVRLDRQMRNHSPERLALIRHIVQENGWTLVHESGRVRPDPGSVSTWLQSSLQEQRLTVGRVWRDSSTWNDLFHVPQLRPDNTAVWQNDPLEARHAILKHLACCEVDRWYAIDDFVSQIREVDSDFQRPSGDYDKWYIRDATTNEYLKGFDSWDAVEGALIRYVLREPLYWLGWVNLGHCRPEGTCDRFSLTSVGASVVGSEDAPPEPEEQPLGLYTDFSVRVPASRRYERFQLARIADWVASGDLYVYRITPRSLERARQQGITVTRVLDFLARTTCRPVPRSVEAALTRWDVRGTEAQLVDALVLRLSSEELMDQVVTSPVSRELVLERLGPTLVIVRRQDWTRVIVALGKLGLLSDADSAEPPDIG